MGTEVRISVWTADEARAVDACAQAFAEFDRLERLMSVWIPGSDVERLNDAAGTQPVAVSPEVLEVLQIARQISEWSDGAFDVTFAALSGLWKFDAQDKDGSVPDRAAILARLPFINYRDLIVDPGANTAFLKRAGMRVNLSGIGKGYAVDRAVALIRARALPDFMLQAGGDFYVAGRHGDRPWRVGIRDPRGPADRIFAALDLSDGTISTSGDYERFFFKEGVRYHHILDLRTGEPARASRSVTLVTSRAVLADALAKAVFVLGPRDGLALLERVPHVEGVIVGATNEVVVSRGLKNRLDVRAAPTDAP
jgi:FAD:protein FMN transferase